RQAAGQQNNCIDGANQHVQVPARLLELARVPRAIREIAGEQRAEDQHFGGQEEPHAQRPSVALLLDGVEMVRQVGGTPSHPPRLPSSIRRANECRGVSWQRYRWAAAKAPAPPARWPPTGLLPPACRSRATRSSKRAAECNRRPGWRRPPTT